MATSKLKFLVVKAHPHDFTHCAGTLGIHTSLGDEVTLVTVTGGAFIHNEELEDELRKPKEEQNLDIINQAADNYGEQKASELRDAASIFGITDIRILSGNEPFKKSENRDIIEQLAEIVLEIRPDVLITQSPYINDTGPHGLTSASDIDDHVQTAYAVADALYLAASPRPGSKVPPHRIPPQAQFYPGVYFNRRDLDFSVDITDWFEQRVEAENMFKSQGHYEAFSRKRIEIAAGAAGWATGTGYAEGFVRATAELLPKISLSEYTVRAATESPLETHKRMVGE